MFRLEQCHTVPEDTVTANSDGSFIGCFRSYHSAAGRVRSGHAQDTPNNKKRNVRLGVTATGTAAAAKAACVSVQTTERLCVTRCCTQQKHGHECRTNRDIARYVVAHGHLPVMNAAPVAVISRRTKFCFFALWQSDMESFIGHGQRRRIPLEANGTI